MKHLKLLSSFFLILLVSCNSKKEQYTLPDSEKEKIESIVENSLWINYFSKTINSPAQIKIGKSTVKEINGKPYLVSIYGEYRAVSMLEENSKTKHYVYAGISCTSKTGADTDGCIPETKTKCTPCSNDENDCVKTVTRDTE
ncbi:hypothetical protein [Capnocytophaga felis]|uniref:Lipoprotein n=1 Tax=Capnocytophaga felis TaxID=2267611 RepID=A0A5M4BAL2_9FLAO|nr:hypothetical protein [Capnocytophaga felis]GET46633.1 hypothetical protein RCZ01_19350 [Capnocytophaga felis]GET48735.1 hypothetical protein RCZ02_15660 [Capnocytophaga felis]